MPTYTSPDNIYMRAVGDTASDVTESQLQGASIQAALSTRGYRWADSAARTGQTGMVIYSLGVQLDTGVIYRYDGSAWKAWDSGWIDYNATLTLTGFSVGTGGSALKSGFYRYVNGVVEVKVRFIFGSSGGVITSAPPIFSLPVNSLSPHIIWAYDGEAQFYDLSSTTTTFGGIVSPATNSVSSVAFVTKFAPSTGASSVISPAYVTATVPFTLGAGDYFEARFRYDPA